MLKKLFWKKITFSDGYICLHTQCQALNRKLLSILRFKVERKNKQEKKDNRSRGRVDPHIGVDICRL